MYEHQMLTEHRPINRKNNVNYLGFNAYSQISMQSERKGKKIRIISE